jgi:hypothetical protein
VFKKIAYSLTLLSVLIIQSHAIFKHHHDFSLSNNEFGHTSKDHNVFSFVNIDEDFILEEYGHVNFEFIPEFMSQELQFPVSSSCTKEKFLRKNEFPPPDPLLRTFSLRGPPSHFFA